MESLWIITMKLMLLTVEWERIFCDKVETATSPGPRDPLL